MTKEEIFRDIAEKTSGKDCSNLPGLCPDQYVCTIKDIQTDYFSKRMPIFNDGKFSVIKENIPKAENIFILILESPHIAEYFEQLSKTQYGEMRKNPCPAMGKVYGDTGYNIRAHIAKIFPNFSNYHLILMNTIPFQCSLGLNLSNNETNKKTRDAVFNAVWDDENIGANFFERRLENLLDALLGKNVVIVNACTQGTKKSKPLCCQVCKSIINVIQNYCDDEKSVESPVAFYHIHHPSSWTYGNTTLNKDKTSISKESNDFNCKEDKNLEKCYGKIKYNIE